MGHTFKRLLSLVVALFLVISLIPVGALPAKAASAIEMNYDDRLSISELGGNSASSVAITAQSVTSKQVESTNADSAVLTYTGGTLIATGTGTATVTVDGTAYSVTVKAAPISLVMVTGHSVGAGQTGNAGQSVVCPDGQVYTTYGTSLAGAATAGVGLGYASASRPAGIDASTAAGDGTIGEGSALAYRWNQLTGEKIWVLNTSVGGTSLKKWIQGGSCYENAVAVYKYAQAVLTAEQAAGHYVLKDEAIIYHSAANWGYKPEENGYWSDADGEGWYESMISGYKAELGVETIGLVPIWTESSKNSYSADTPANFWMGANAEYPGLFMASVATRTWLRDITTFPAITYTTQGTAVSMPTDSTGILADDNVHLDQVAYNGAGLDIAQNLYNYLRTQQTAQSVVLRDGNHKLLGDSIALAVGDSIKLVPEVAPLSVNDLTFTLTANLSLSYPGVITGTADGMGKVVISQGENVLKELKVAVGDASEEIPTYPDEWNVEYHCVCGNPVGTGTPCAQAGHQMVEWKPWTNTNTVPYLDGYWYLPQDLNLSSVAGQTYETGFSTATGILGYGANANDILNYAVNVYVDLNGKTVTGKSGHRIYRLEPGYAHHLTITDTVGTGKLVAVSVNSNTNQGMVIWTRSGLNKVTLYGGTLDASGVYLNPTSSDEGKTAAGVAVNLSGTMEIYGGSILGGTIPGANNAQGGAIINYGTLNVYKGSITGGSITGINARGGAVYNAGTMNVHGGTITGGSITSTGTASNTYAQGGAIFNDNGKTLNIYGGTIIGGTAKATTNAQGGNIRNQGKLNIYGGTIKDGTAEGGTTQGGNVSNVSTFYMEGGTITGGIATGANGGYGGSFFTTTGGTIKGGTIKGGRATSTNSANKSASGGCIFNYGGTLDISGDALIENGAAYYGGNINIGGGTLNMTGGTIRDGRAVNVAGAVENSTQGANIYVKATANISGGLIQNDPTDTRAYRGAGVYAVGTVNVSGGVIAAGRASDLGGSIGTQPGGTINITGGTITAAYYSNGMPITDPADAQLAATRVSCAGAAVGSWGGTIKVSGGTIIGGTIGGAGGACISVHGGTQLTVSGGLITGAVGSGSNALYGGAISIYGSASKATITGGTITGNKIWGGAVLVREKGNIEISGDAVIEGNTNQNGAACDLNLSNVTATSGSYSQTYVVVGELSEKASIGITTTATGAFTTAAVTAESAAAFFADAAGTYVEQQEDGKLILASGHKAHCVCGGSDTHSGCDHTALEGEWKPWDGTTNISEGGNYYLTQSITKYQMWMGGAYTNTTEMTINLCLNGHSLTSSGRVFGIAPKVTFNLMNCSHNQSVLTGKQTNATAGTIFMYNSTAVFNMYDNIKVVGATTGTKVTNGGAIYIPGEFNMYGGEVVGQRVSGHGGSVWVGGAGTFNLYDGIIRDGSADGGNGGGNIYLTEGSKFTMHDGLIKNGIVYGGHGGNLKIMADCVVEIKGGIIEGGKAVIAEDASNKDINGGNIAMVDQDSDDLGGLTIGGTTIIRNGEANRGGNIFIHTGSMKIEGSVKIEGGVGYGYVQNNHPSVEVNWSRGEATVNNRTYVAISGTPTINEIYYNDYIDTTGLQAGADIGVNRKAEGKVSSAALAADVASGIYSTNPDLIMVNEKDALYAKSVSGLHYHDLCNGENYAVCDHSNINFTPISSVTELKAPGNYYLTADIVEASEITISGSGVINLCLNGYSWSAAGRNAIIGNNITMNIVNCSETQSVISGRGNAGTANTDTVRGGVFCVWSKSTLNVIGNIQLLRTDSSNTNLQGGIISSWGNVGLYGVIVDGNALSGANAMTGGLLRLESSYTTTLTIVDCVLKNGWCSNGGAIMTNGSNQVVNISGTTIRNMTATYTGGGAIHNSANSTINVGDGTVFESCKCTGDKKGGAIYNAGTVNITGKVTIENCQAKYGGAIHNEGGTVTLNSGLTITGCTGTWGTIYVNGGTVNINSGVTIKDCNPDEGGAVYMEKGTCNMNGARIENCSSGNGSAVYLWGGTFNMNSGSVISGCTGKTTYTYQNGGAFHLQNASAIANIKAGALIENCSVNNGGGAFNIKAGTVNFAGTVKNTSAKYGGAGYMSGGTFNMEGGLVTDCFANGSGGGSFMVDGASTKFNLSGGTIQNGRNTKTVANDVYGGGNMMIYQSTLTITGGKILNGVATFGGNISLTNGGKLVMTGGTVEGGQSFGGHGGNISVKAECVAEITGGTVKNGVANPAAGADPNNKDAMDKCGGNIAVVHNSDKTTIATLKVGGTAKLIGGTGDRAGNIFVHSGKLEISGTPSITGGTALNKGHGGGNPCVHVNFVEDNGINSCFVTVSGKPTIENMRVASAMDLSGLEAGAKIGITNSSAVKLSKAPLTAEVAACFTSTNANLKLVNQEDALYLRALDYHVYDDGKVTTAPGCTDLGVLTYTCIYCGETKTESIDATGHNEVIDEAVKATCTQTGLTEGSHCDICGATIVAQQIVPKTELTYVAAVEASCHQNGRAEYWYCAECDIVFADADATLQTNVKNLTIPATVGLTYVEAREATCHQTGHAEYWYCAECEAIFTDAAGTMLTNIKNISTPALLGLTHVEAQEATCHQAGHAEYWYCMECEAIFADAAGTMLTNIKNLATPALVGLTHVEAQEATCHQRGHAEYWYCAECEAIFADAAGMQLTNIKNLSTPALLGLTYVPAAEASCHQNGHAEYWYCMECEAIFADAAGTMLTNIKNLAIEAAPLTYVAAQEPTYYANGHYEYWYCTECEAVFADAAGIQLTNIKNLTIPMLTAYAQIGEIRYGTLAEAMEAAVANDVIQLLLSTTIDGIETWDLGDVTLDLGENTLTVNGELTILSGTYVGNILAETGKIAISGGLFSAKVPDAYCAEGYIATVVPNEGGLYTVVALGDTVAQNQNTGEVYTTVAAALMAAENTTHVIKLFADSNEYSVVVPAGVGLDLNGKTLIASYVNAFGPISDSTGTGLLKTTQGKATLFAQEQLSVWNGEGYIFIGNIALSADTNVKIEQTEKGLEFSFLPVLNAQMRELLANGGNDNGVKLAIRLTWDRTYPNVEDRPYDVVFSDTFVEKVYSSATAEWCFVLTVKNAANLSNLTFNIVLISDTGAELVSQTIG